MHIHAPHKRNLLFCYRNVKCGYTVSFSPVSKASDYACDITTIGVPANQVVMLGDTPYDIEAARKIGVGTICTTFRREDIGSLVGERVVFNAGKLMFSKRVFRHVKCYRGWYTCMICGVVITLFECSGLVHESAVVSLQWVQFIVLGSEKPELFQGERSDVSLDSSGRAAASGGR
jgi:hypothetical protein